MAVFRIVDEANLLSKSVITGITTYVCHQDSEVQCIDQSHTPASLSMDSLQADQASCQLDGLWSAFSVGVSEDRNGQTLI